MTHSYINESLRDDHSSNRRKIRLIDLMTHHNDDSSKSRMISNIKYLHFLCDSDKRKHTQTLNVMFTLLNKVNTIKNYGKKCLTNLPY